MSAVDLTDAHEILIAEYESLERTLEQLKLSKQREGERLRNEIKELRRQLRMALLEVEELQGLLSRSWVKT